MVQLGKQYNVPGVNDQGFDGFEPLPAGEYIAAITESSMKETKKKDGQYLQLIWKVQVGEYANRLIYDNLNLIHNNPQAVEIANKKLNSICQACEKVGVTDSELLHGTPVLLKVVVKPATQQNPASNNINSYKKPTQEDFVKAQQAATVATDAPSMGGMPMGGAGLGAAANIPTPTPNLGGVQAAGLPTGNVSPAPADNAKVSTPEEVLQSANEAVAGGVAVPTADPAANAGNVVSDPAPNTVQGGDTEGENTQEAPAAAKLPWE